MLNSTPVMASDLTFSVSLKKRCVKRADVVVPLQYLRSGWGASSRPKKLQRTWSSSQYRYRRIPGADRQTCWKYGGQSCRLILPMWHERIVYDSCWSPDVEKHFLPRPMRPPRILYEYESQEDHGCSSCRRQTLSHCNHSEGLIYNGGYSIFDPESDK